MRRRLGPPGVLAGVAGSLLLALGVVLIRDLPSTGASALDVYAYFLDDRDAAKAGAAASIVGLALLVPFLSTTRIGGASPGPTSTGNTTLVAGAIAIAAAAFSAAVIGGLAVGAENADAASSRTLLDVAQALGAAAGPLFAVAILSAAAGAYAEDAPAWVPLLWVACALGCLLWLGPLVNDAAILGYGTALGTYAGVGGLFVWTASTALLARRPDPRLATSEPE